MITFQNFLDDFTGMEIVAYSSTGTAVPAGYGSASVGYFATLTDAQLTGGGARIAADFVTFGSSVSMGAGFSVPGLFKGAPTMAINAGSPFIGQSIYLLIVPTSSLAAAKHYIVYKFDQTFGQDAPLFNTTVNLAGAPMTGASLLVGRASSETQDVGAGPFRTIQFQGLLDSSDTDVPEPSALVLLFGGVTIGLRRRDLTVFRL